MMRWMRWGAVWAVFAVLPLSAQPVSPGEAAAFAASRDEAVRPYYFRLYRDGAADAVLNLVKLGLIELQRGRLKDAEWLFDRAAERIAADGAAGDFRGEDYERNMAFYYRGLVKLMLGDTAAAYGSFVHSPGLAAMDFLAGWTQRCRDGDMLLIVETGTGPKKMHGRRFGEAAVILPGEGGSSIGFLAERADGRRVGASAMPGFAMEGPGEDLFDEDGKLIPALDTARYRFAGIVPVVEVNVTGMTLAGPVTVEPPQNTGANAAATIGDVALDASKRAPLAAKVGLGAAALIANTASAALTTAADIRGWDTLPAAIAIATLRWPGDGASVNWVKLRRDGIAAGPPSVLKIVDQGRCRLAWVHEKDPAVLPQDIGTAPPADPRDAAFRAQLMREFSRP